MRIIVNGDWRELGCEPAAGTPSPTLDLARALERLGYIRSVVATALNGEFIAASARGETPLREGDRLEVLSPMQGG